MRALIALAVAVVAAMSSTTSLAAAGPEPRGLAAPLALLVRDIDPVAGSEPRELTRMAGRVFFSADDGTHGRELWISDGTKTGTRLVRDVRPGGQGSAPRHLTQVGSRLFFSAQDGIHGRELWVTDGTRAGTRLVKDVTKGPQSSAISEIADGAGIAFFTRAYRELWRSDGTAGGTAHLRTFTGVTVEDAPSLGGRLIFSADDALWKSNGTPAGTRRLSSIFWGLDGLTTFRGDVYFRADPPRGAFGGVPQLWRSDGTKAGTKRLGTSLDPTSFTVKGNRLFFDAQQSASKAPRLYRSDGTAEGTVPVKPRVRPLLDMCKAAGRLWAIDGSPSASEPDELWVSDGSAAGTSLVRGGTGDWQIQAWDESAHVGLAGRLWFTASPSVPSGGSVDAEVWSSDGTTGGTVEAVDINAVGSSSPREYVKLGRGIVFTADDGIHGRELWSVRPS